MTEKEIQDLIEEAKLRYPIGTKFKLVHVTGQQSTVKHHNIKHRDNYLSLGSGCKESNFYTETLYYDGRWAEIISKPFECVFDVFN